MRALIVLSLAQVTKNLVLADLSTKSQTILDSIIAVTLRVGF
jgi:hypothetical protein